MPLANNIVALSQYARAANSAAMIIPLMRRKPDPWQYDVLNRNHSRMIFCCSRQVGKSFTAAIKAYHTAAFKKDSLILILAPSQRQAKELLYKLVTIHYLAKLPIKMEYSRTEAFFPTMNSRILALPAAEDTIRAYSEVTLFILDEASRISDQLYNSITPMLAVSQGDIIALSTPFGGRGWFYQAWHKEDDWLKVEIPATMCPRISADFLERERKRMGDRWFEQEYMCKFVDPIEAVFAREYVDQAFTEDFPVLRIA